MSRLSSKNPSRNGLSLLDDARLVNSVCTLSHIEPRFARIVARHGMPPLWPRQPGFATLALLMLEQQVSLAQARTMFQRIVAAAGEMTPEAVRSLGVEGLRAIGVTRQKSAYLHALADTLVGGGFDIHALSAMADDAVADRLDALHGVGQWTAQCYLLFALRRPDAFPAADLALMESTRALWRLRARPSPEALLKRAEAWRPWRSVAARLLWHHYLSERA
jgi:DNA-3-methyladenine glycosylase II